jgi:cytochrome P450
MTTLTPSRLALRTPPRSHRLPLVGPLAGMIRNPLTLLSESQARHGDIYTLDMGVARLIMLNRPEHVQHVFVDRADNYSKGGALWESVRTLLGNGLPVSEGDFWLRQRRMMQPHFHRRRLSGLTTLLVASADEALASWDAHLGRPFNVAGAFAPVTMHVISRLLFGQGLERREIDAVGVSMSYMLDYVLVGSLFSGFPAWMPKPGARRFQRCLAGTDEVISRLISSQRQGEAGEDTLLAMLVDMVDTETGTGMTDPQLRDEVLSMFLAGYETTSLTLSWIFHYLTQQPEIAERLQAEVDAVLGGRTPRFEDLPSLSYTRMVVSEALRIRPPAWMVTRTAVADDEIDGYHIPAGALVWPSFYNVQHHADYWEEPDRFDPERFSPERSANRHRYAWVPFGAGQRMCIGKDLAVMEAQVILALIFQRYSFTAQPSAATAQASGTLKPNRPVMITLHRRPA